MDIVGDIGATNARFALVTPGGALSRTANLLCADYPSLGDALRAYLTNVGGTKPAAAVLAVATTPHGDSVAFTNNDWSFSIDALRRELGIARLQVINDFHANALAVPHLAENDLFQVGTGMPQRNAPKVVIGPGSGLGVSAVIPSANGFIAVSGEGGHVTMPPSNDEESAVLGLLRQWFDHVSAERVLSGPGLVNLYGALCELHGQAASATTAAEICQPETIATDACARNAVEMFCAMLGTVASNLALTLGAGGGVYIAGGIVPRFGASFANSPFRTRFEAKGRFRSYLAGIPTYVITHPHAALIGAATLRNPAAR